jgi:hypothetical protein
MLCQNGAHVQVPFATASWLSTMIAAPLYKPAVHRADSNRL